MTDHDDLCPWPDPTVDPAVCAYCELIIAARRDERERIAQAIEGLPWDERSGRQVYSGPVTWARSMAYARAARIARGGNE